MAAPGFPGDCCLQVFVTQSLSKMDRKGTYGAFLNICEPSILQKYPSVTEPSENLMKANRSSSQVNSILLSYINRA